MTLTARVAPLLPTRLVAAVARAVYPRFEPELARLGELCPADCGTAVDVGGTYRTATEESPPWSGILARDRPALFVELESRIQPIGPVVTYLSLLGYEGWVLPGRDWIPFLGTE